MASGHSRYAVPTCTPAAPSASAAATPVASAMPPAAITGTRTARTICGTRANVPVCVLRSPERKIPRCPPASRPWAMIASTPRASSQRASSTVVADDTIFAPDARTRASRSSAGSPKWKLTTAGLNSSSTPATSRLNGSRPGPVAIAFGSIPCSARVGGQRRVPPAFVVRVRFGLRMAEEVDVVRPRRRGAEGSQLVADAVDVQHGAGQRSQAAGVRHGDGERAALHTRHRRLNDRQLDAEHLLKRHRNLTSRVHGGWPRGLEAGVRNRLNSVEGGTLCGSPAPQARSSTSRRLRPRRRPRRCTGFG